MGMKNSFIDQINWLVQSVFMQMANSSRLNKFKLNQVNPNDEWDYMFLLFCGYSFEVNAHHINK